MKIIIVNYRYFISGGPERYLFNIKDLFEKNGHEVIPFSIKYNKNLPSSYENYFMDPIGNGNEVFANQYKRNNLKTVFTVLSRMLYSFEAKSKLKKLIKDTSPDLVYVLYYQNKMSASIIDAAYEMKVPVIQRISDFGHICADNIFYNFKLGEVCERCLHGSRINAIKYKCVNNSYFNSFVKVMALKIQDIRKTTQKISAFVIPAEFTVQKFREFGIPEKKIHFIPTFYNNKKDDSPGEITYENFFLYVGRVDRDKGILTLAKAFEDTCYKLVIIGSSQDGYDTEIKKYLLNKNHNISFLGMLGFEEIKPYLKSCLCTICPSEWYDNLPNSVLESYGYSKAVIASRLGSLKDVVVDNQTGLTFTAANHLELRSKVKYLFENKPEAIRLGSQAKEKLLTEYSENLHYERLLYLFNKTISEKN